MEGVAEGRGLSGGAHGGFTYDHLRGLDAVVGQLGVEAGGDGLDALGVGDEERGDKLTGALGAGEVGPEAGGKAGAGDVVGG